LYYYTTNIIIIMSAQQLSIDSTLDHAIQLNNEAVRQTLAGCDEQAVVLFSKALCVFKSLISQDTSNHNSPSQSMLLDSTEPLPQFDEKNFFVFNSVITLFTRIEDQKPADTHIYCLAIILNIAVIYHRQAFLGQRDALVKAERFYDMVTKNASDRGTGLMIKLAAINKPFSNQIREWRLPGSGRRIPKACVVGQLC
jgi:hypothetical protein